MQLPSEFPGARSPGFRHGLAWRAQNLAAACFQAVAKAADLAWLPARSRLLLLSVVLAMITAGGMLAGYCSSRAAATGEIGRESPYWERISQLDLKNLATTGKNPYFNLEPGYRLCYSDGESTRTMLVQRRTKLIDGVQTRVVQEKEEQHGQTAKIVWRYYAIDKTTAALYCFGVHTQVYSKGCLVSHRGWRSGSHAAMFTLVLPAAPRVGDHLLRNHRPDAPRRMEEVISVAATVATPAGTFTNCVSTQSKGSKESRVKVFAPGVGLVQDGAFVLEARQMPHDAPRASL